MSVQVTMPEKKDEGFGKLMQVGQMAMQAKGMFGKGGSSAQMPDSATAMTRRMETLKKQRDMGNDQGSMGY